MPPIHFGEKGQSIAHLQRALVERGFELPRFGIDGHLGEECWDALQRFAENEGLAWAPEVPPSVLAALGRPRRTTPVPILNDTSLEEPQTADVVDLREACEEPHPKARTVAGMTVRRPADSVDAIMIHQTAVEFGLAPYQLQAAAGDRRVALARRAQRVACHALAFCDGFVCLPAPLRWYIHHGNGLNARSLGLEIEGNYPGVLGGTTVNGKTATEVTETVVVAARHALRLLVENGRNEGCPIQFIYAHRQTSNTRRADPGEALWRSVVLEYAVPVLGLKTQPARTWGTGLPIPRAWDPDGVGEY